MKIRTKQIAKKRPRPDSIEYKDVSLQEFLGLSDAENEVVELKFRLAKALQQERKAGGITEKELAARMRTHQPAINRMLNETNKVTLDTILTVFFALGKSRKEIAKLIAAGPLVPSRTATTPATKVIRKRALRG